MGVGFRIERSCGMPSRFLTGEPMYPLCHLATGIDQMNELLYSFSLMDADSNPGEFIPTKIARKQEVIVYENEFHPLGGVSPEAFARIADWLADQLGVRAAPGGGRHYGDVHSAGLEL